MTPTPEMLQSVPFQYAQDVRDGNIVVGKRIKQAVERFYRWIDEADDKGFYLDHSAGMHIVDFYPKFLNHTEGKFQGKPFHLAPFQQFTLYNLFGWKNKATGFRRITRVYDRRGKKNGKSAEMAGLCLYGLSFDKEMSAQIYVGATKEDQARICWNQAASFVDSPVSNPALRSMGFYVQQKVVGFKRTKSKMMPLGGDSKTQDGINTHIGIVDEYHAHADDGVKKNMESSAVLRSQPIIYHITTAGTNIQSACKRYEDEICIPALEGQAELNHLWVMIHEMDEGDDWEDSSNWIKANPLLNQGLALESLLLRYEEIKLRPSDAPEFKTKNLNMWVDAPSVWIPSEIWKKCKHDLTPEQVAQKFQDLGGYAGGDLSTKLDITAYVQLSNPDEFGDRYVVPFFFCPNDNIIQRSKSDKVPYLEWREKGLLIATDGNVVDYKYVETVIYDNYTTNNIERIDFDPWNASDLLSRLMERGINVSELQQNMAKLSEPTKEFEALVHSGKIRHDGNPILAWMLAGATPIYDTKGNMMIAKGRSVDGAKRRIDGIAATINALAGYMSPPEDTNESKYNNPDTEIFI